MGVMLLSILYQIDTLIQTFVHFFFSHFDNFINFFFLFTFLDQLLSQLRQFYVDLPLCVVVDDFLVGLSFRLQDIIPQCLVLLDEIKSALEIARLCFIGHNVS